MPAALVAKTVDREIYPDLADAAERREDQFVLRHQVRSLAATGKTSPAVIVCNVPSAKAQQQLAAFVERLGTADKFAIFWQPHPHLAAYSRGTIEPIGTNGLKTCTTMPLRQPPRHRT